jgi:hypothetical protein
MSSGDFSMKTLSVADWRMKIGALMLGMEDRAMLEPAEVKRLVLSRISGGKECRNIGGAKYRIGSQVVHVRFCANPVDTHHAFSFGINPNTLTADWELWICGDKDTYYLLPASLVQAIYKNPNTYIDHTHPEIRVATVDLRKHVLRFGRHLESDVTQCFCSQVPNDVL